MDSQLADHLHEVVDFSVHGRLADVQVLLHADAGRGMPLGAIQLSAASHHGAIPRPPQGNLDERKLWMDEGQAGIYRFVRRISTVKRLWSLTDRLSDCRVLYIPTAVR